MPNWCYTTINIAGSGKDLAILDENFVKASEFDKIQTDFGKDWLGNLVEYCGKSYTEVSCRGSIINYQFDKDTPVINLMTETAWNPLLEPIFLIIDKFAPDCCLTYTAEEGGVGLYITNDPDVEGKYRVELYDEDEAFSYDDEELHEYLSKDDLKDYLEDSLGKKDILPFLIREAVHDHDIGISQFEYCSIGDL